MAKNTVSLTLEELTALAAMTAEEKIAYMDALMGRAAQQEAEAREKDRAKRNLQVAKAIKNLAKSVQVGTKPGMAGSVVENKSGTPFTVSGDEVYLDKNGKPFAQSRTERGGFMAVPVDDFQQDAPEVVSARLLDEIARIKAELDKLAASIAL